MMMFKKREEAMQYAKEQRKSGKKIQVKKINFQDLARETVWTVE